MDCLFVHLDVHMSCIILFVSRKVFEEDIDKILGELDWITQLFFPRKTRGDAVAMEDNKANLMDHVLDGPFHGSYPLFFFGTRSIQNMLRHLFRDDNVGGLQFLGAQMARKEEIDEDTNLFLDCVPFHLDHKDAILQSLVLRELVHTVQKPHRRQIQ